MLAEGRAEHSAEQQLRETCAELESRLRAGHESCAEDFLARDPELFRDCEAALELVYAEFVMRAELQQQPDPAAWYARFPQWRERLERLFEVHHLVCTGADTDALSGAATPFPRRGEGPPPVGEAERGPLGAYELIEKMAHGGMGVVYKARQVGLDRVVALKMILAGAHAEPEDLARFRAEGEAAAQLQHLNIVQIHEVGERDGLPYFSLEFVEGGSLAQKLGGKPMPAVDAARLIETLARAMHYAHQRGVVHRDLKPANVLLGADGTPKIADFGLAKRLQAGADHTHTGTLTGTPSYMAPEQAAGECAAMGATTDVYGLGATFYELLTGRPPFQGTSPLDTLEQVRSVEPVPPSRLQPKLPRDLETICLKCLQKVPGRRYASALDLADDLQRFLAGKPIQARPVGAPERVWRWCRRNPAVASLTAALALALIGGIAGVTWKWLEAVEEQGHARAEADAKEAARAREEEERRRKEAALEESEQALYFNRIALAHREWAANNAGATEELLDACPVSRRGWEWWYLKRLCHSELHKWRYPNQPGCLRYSPDGRYLACGGNHGVMVRDVATGRFEKALKLADTLPVHQIVFSSDGTWLAEASYSQPGKTRITISVASTGEALDRFSLDRQVTNLVLQPTGQVLALCPPHDVFQVDKLTGIPRALALTGIKNHSVRAIDFDGQRLACAGPDKFLKLVDVANGSTAVVLPQRSDAIDALEFSRDGRRLAGIDRDLSVKIWDTATGALLLRFYPELREMRRLRFSPDGERLAILSGLRRINFYSAQTGQALFELRGHACDIRDLAFHPTGQQVATSGSDGFVKLWDLTDGQEARTALRLQERVWDLALSSNGRFVGYRTGDKAIKIWDTCTGVLLGTYSLARDDSRSALTFSADSRRAYLVQATQVTTWALDSGKEPLPLAGSSTPTSIRLQPPPAVAPAFNLFTAAGNVAISPDGALIGAVWDARTIKIFSATTGRELFQFPGHKYAILPFAFSPDSKLLAASGDDNTVKLWHLATGQPHSTLAGHSAGIGGLAFSPGGRHLASSSSDGTIRIWEVDSGRLCQVLRGLTSSLTHIAYHPDGERLASAGFDGTIRIWEPRTGQEVMTFRGHIAGLRQLAFSEDGHRLIAVNINGTVMVWDGTPLTPASDRLSE